MSGSGTEPHRVRWIDVTIPVSPGMTVWPGDPPVTLDPDTRIARGDGSNTSILRLGTHTGTHVDAPWHFEDGGKRLDEVDTALFFGPAELREVFAVGHVRSDDLGPSPLPSRLLLRTSNSRIPGGAPFCGDYVALHPDAAERLVDERVTLVGVDYLSVAPFRQPGQDTHHILLRNNVLIVEGLELGGIPAGPLAFVVLPLALVGADGAPCRAFVGLEERDG